MESRFKDTLRSFWKPLCRRGSSCTSLDTDLGDQVCIHSIQCINFSFISQAIILNIWTIILTIPHSQAILIPTYKNVLRCEREKSFLSKKVSRIARFYSDIPHTFPWIRLNYIDMRIEITFFGIQHSKIYQDICLNSCSNYISMANLNQF